MNRGEKAALLAIFAVTLAARLYFAFSTPYFSGDDAYFSVRQTEHIRAAGLPLYDDPLSFSGRTTVFPPLFDYLLAAASLVFPLGFALKFFPNLFASSIVLLSFLIAMKITRNSRIAIFTAFISSFVPVYFANTVNSISPYSIVAPLTMLLLYSFMSLESKKWVYCYIISVIALAFIHPSAILFVLGLLLYLTLIKVEGLQLRRAEVEAALFATFFVILAQFLMFKKVFLFHGPNVIWQNIPLEMLSRSFAGTTILGAVYLIGAVPFVSGLYITYRHVLKEKKHQVYLLLGFALSAGILLWTRLIRAETGMIFLGLVFALMFSQFLREALDYAKKTKFSRHTALMAAALIIIFVFSSVIPSLSYAQQAISKSITYEDEEALKWIRENTPEDSVIAAAVEEGNLITAIAGRRNIIDSNFLYITDAAQRYADIERLFTTISETEAISIMGKHSAGYIYFSPTAMKKYNTRGLNYVDGKCFSLVYDKKIKVYRLECRMGML